MRETADVPAERLEGLNWRGSTLPLPSAFSLLAVPARLGAWDRTQLGALLQRQLTAASPPYLGWAALAEIGTLSRVSCALNRRPESVRLSAELVRWWPPALRTLRSRLDDPTTFERLRFCRPCLRRGDHSPLFQLPWWSGCPVHDEPLCEDCPQCHTPIPAGLPHADPARWLVCPHCHAELSDRALLAHLHAAPTRLHDDRWWLVLAAYRRWLAATHAAGWALPWSVQGEGSFSDVAHLAVRHLVRRIAPPAELTRHLPVTTLTSAGARAWSRTFIETPTAPSVRELGFASPQAMINAGRRFYGALPITETCRRALNTAERHLRRQLRVPLIGDRSPRGVPGAKLYDWRGPRTLSVLAFRLLTGLAQTDRVQGVAYLDFRAVQLLLETPAWMARNLLASWTGVDLHDLHAWPKDLTTLLVEQKWMLRKRGPAPGVRRHPQPRNAFSWLYERMILEAWQDLALECFSRARPDGVLAWTIAPAPLVRSPREQNFYVPLKAPIDADAVVSELAHPLLEHARADRCRPRGWATAIMRAPGKGPETYIALLGRAAALPFAPRCEPSFNAHWTWPEEMAPGDAPPELSATA